MKKIICLATVVSVIFISQPAFAEDSSSSTTIENSVVENNNEQSNEVPEPTPEPTPEPAPEPTPDPTPEPGMSQGEHGGWAAVNPDGSIVGGIMVCTPEVCGQTGPGSWLDIAIQNGVLPPGVRLVLQTLQDPVEAANSPNGIGNVAGFSDATYSFENNEWTFQNQGATYRIPLAYPGRDQGGNENSPECVLDCPTEEPEPLVDGGEGIGQNSPSQGGGEETVTIQQRSNSFFVDTKNNSINYLTISVKNKTKYLYIIAKKPGKTKTWKIITKRNKNFVKFKIPKKYDGWNIFITNKNRNIVSVVGTLKKV